METLFDKQSAMKKKWERMSVSERREERGFLRRASQTKTDEAARRPVYTDKFLIVDGRCTSGKSGVYLIGSRLKGLYKIGCASDLYKRLSDFRTFPLELDVIKVWEVMLYVRKVFEYTLHGEFKNQRQMFNGSLSEWFSFSSHDLENAIKKIDSLHLSFNEEVRDGRNERIQTTIRYEIQKSLRH